MRMLHWALVPSALVSAQLQAQTTRMTCEYFNAATNVGTVEQQPCTATESPDHQRMTFRTGDVTVVIEDSGERQGQWARVTLNGKPASRYELYRQSYVVATDDLTEFFDVRDRGAPKYPTG